jgi:hypothetical protein
LSGRRFRRNGVKSRGSSSAREEGYLREA